MSNDQRLFFVCKGVDYRLFFIDLERGMLLQSEGYTLWR